MDQRAVHRTPSPGHPLQHGYQLDDHPYGRQPQNLEIPTGPGVRYGTPSDQLQLNAAVSPSPKMNVAID
jgi:chitin synthase